MTRICALCSRGLGVIRDGRSGTTQGICPACLVKTLREYQENLSPREKEDKTKGSGLIQTLRNALGFLLGHPLQTGGF